MPFAAYMLDKSQAPLETVRFRLAAPSDICSVDGQLYPCHAILLVITTTCRQRRPAAGCGHAAVLRPGQQPAGRLREHRAPRPQDDHLQGPLPIRFRHAARLRRVLHPAIANQVFLTQVRVTLEMRIWKTTAIKVGQFALFAGHSGTEGAAGLSEVGDSALILWL